MKTFEQFTRDLENDQLDEGFFDFLKDLFTNPIQKRKLKKLAKELQETIVDKMTLKLEGDPVEELETELEEQDPSYSYSPGKPSMSRSIGGGSSENPHAIKIKLLEEKEAEILEAMDQIGQENETLKKYVTTVKLEAKIEATEKLMRVADSVIKRKLAQIRKNDQKEVKVLNKAIAKEVKESYMFTEASETEAMYDDYPSAAKANAKKAIEWKEKYGRDEVTGGTEVGWARAHQLAKGEKLSKDVVSRMAQFNRHRKNSKIATEYKDTPWKDRGYIAWLIWGGDEGVDWAMKKMDEIQTNESLNEERPEWQDADWPDAEGRFVDLSPKDLAAWLIKTRKKDLKAISGALTQQVVFNRNEDPEYADKMEKTRKEVYKQLDRKDLLDKMDESLILEIGDASAKPFKWKANNNIRKEMKKLFDDSQKLAPNQSIEVNDGRFDYTFTNDDGIEYVVNLLGWMQNNGPQPNFTGKPLPDTVYYESSFNVAFNTLEGKTKGEEINTNLGEHFRIMSTMTEIINHFMTEAEKSGYPVKTLTVAPKGDLDSNSTLDSKRGRLYMAYVIKQMKNLKTKNEYSVSKSSDGDFIRIQLGKWTYSSNHAIQTEGLKYMPTFEQFTKDI